MKIALIGPAYPLRGGIAHHTFLLNRQLTDRGHSVQAISFKRLYPKFLFPGKRMTDESRLRLDIQALQVLDSLNPGTWFSTFKLIKTFHPDLVVIQWWNPALAPAIGTLARLLGRAGLKCVLECHNVFPHESTFLDLPLLDFVFQSVDDFITHSEQDRSLLLDSFPGKRVRTVPLPDPAVLLDTSYSARDGSTILFFGVVRPYKGLSVLLRAMARAREEVECRLRVAGEFYEAEDHYREIIRQEGLSNCVHIDNRYIPNEEIASLFDGADVLVLPYLSATQSGVARMALAAGLPIIATRVGGLSEAVIENVTGLLVPPGNAEALGATIARYFKCGLGPVLSRSIRLAVSADRYLLARTVEEIAGNNSRDAN